MTAVRKSLRLTQSDLLVEALSKESCHIVLETSPPDYVQKISRYLESTEGHNRQDDVVNDPAGAESDSGDSLFITQKPVPEAVRSRRRHRYSLRSDPTSPKDLEESEDDSLSSASPEESKTCKRRGRKKYRLPKFSFPFLKERKSKPRSTLSSVEQNTSLHNYTMGGFFKCVRELWQSYQSGADLQLPVPTVDMDGQHIPPLSENEEERSEMEDIRVVKRKHFVAPLKTKRSKPWYTPEKGDIEVKEQRRRRGSSARQETSQERQSKQLHKMPSKAPISRATVLSSDTESSENGYPSHRAPAQRETSDKQVRSGRSAVTQTETPKTNRRLTRGNKKILFQEKESEKELCDDSDATLCEALEQGGPREYTLNGREASPNVAEPQADAFHTDDLSQTGQEEDEPESLSLLQSLPDLVSDTNNDRVCNKTRVKRTKKAKGDHESVEEEKDQSQEEPEGPRTAASVSVEAEDTPSLSEDNPAEPPASQTSDEPELNEQNSSHDVPDSKQKKKREKKKAATDDVRQEEDGNSETDVRLETDALFSVTCDMVNGGKEKKKKKKKRKRRVEDDEGVEQLLSSAVSEPVIEDAEIQRKKKKRKKEKVIVDMEGHEGEEALNMTSDRPLVSEGQLEDMGNCLENTEAPQETLESGYEKKRKKHKKKQRSASHDDVQDGAEDGVDLSPSTDVTLEGSTGQALKKKEKKKKKKRESISEGVDISSTRDESTKVNNAENSQKTEEGPDDQDAELVSKKKKKKKKSEIFSRNVSEDAVTQSDDSVSVRKKEKNGTSSFLVADAEEKDAQTHEEQSSLCSTSAAAHVWAAEEPGEFETQSAEIAGNLEASNDGVRKKGRKRKTSVVQESVEEDHKQEPNETCQSSLPETTDTEVKRKKKRKRNESESVTLMERLESSADAGCPPADEAVVLKKKKKKRKEESTSALAAKERNGHGSEITSTPDEETQETLNMAEHASPSSETTGDPASHDVRDMKKKKKVQSSDNVLLEKELSTESAETKTPKTKKKERKKPTSVTSFTSSSPVLSQSEMASSDCISKNTQKKAKRRLHNPCEDFLTDY
ncbi:caldesmon-like [Trachinotus anak]|uniref:caldesmon-like n=1 Tax=Trachinotus anak TaxID=443729 RepID=UPI0039F234BF